MISRRPSRWPFHSRWPFPSRWLLPAVLAALWPVWRWYVAGTLDGSNDGWGLLAAATAIALCWRARQAQLLSEAGNGHHDALGWPAWPLALPLLFLLAYLLATLAGLSPALRAVPAVLALAALASLACFGRRVHLPLFALSLLALPLAASLQFYLGYPLRVVAGSLSALLLQLNGLAVVREGTLLRFGEQVIAIDAPCSGVKMLWAAMYLTYTLAALRGLGSRQTVLAIASALAIVVLGNGVRAAALFYTESGLLHLPPWAHATTGTLVFAACAILIIGTLSRLQDRPQMTGKLSPQPTMMPGSRLLTQRMAVPGFWLLCAAAAVLPFFTTQLATASAKPAPEHTFPGWPAEFEGRALRPLPLSALEQQFQTGFPGKIGRFSDGQREIILRWITHGNRRLHPAADCFKANGYTLQTRPMITKGTARWSRFLATHGTHGSTRLLVSERIIDGAGGQWSDTSAWFWATQLGKTSGPWWAVTVAERAEKI